MAQSNCIYCQLIDNPSQLLVVGETDNFYAWLEVNPRARGHTQIVPKDHIESILELEADMYEEAMSLVREVMGKAVNGLGADGVSVTMNVKEAGGQMLPHAYISVFPRFQEDENAGTPTGAIFPQREGLQAGLEDTLESMKSASVDFGKEKIEAHPEGQKFKSVTKTERFTGEEDSSDDGSKDEPVQDDSDESDKDLEQEDEEPEAGLGNSVEWR